MRNPRRFLWCPPEGRWLKFWIVSSSFWILLLWSCEEGCARDTAARSTFLHCTNVQWHYVVSVIQPLWWFDCSHPPFLFLQRQFLSGRVFHRHRCTTFLRRNEHPKSESVETEAFHKQDWHEFLGLSHCLTLAHISKAKRTVPTRRPNRRHTNAVKQLSNPSARPE